MKHNLISLVVAFLLVCTLAVKPTSANISFVDVATTNYAYDEIQYLIDLGAINGYLENGKRYFKPNLSVTRGHAAKMAVISSGNKPLNVTTSSFSDVKAGTEISSYIERAVQLGFFQAKSGKFNPNEPLTREEMSYVLTKAFNLNPDEYKNLDLPFSDISSSNTYASYIKAIYYNGITNGSPDGKYMAKSPVTRAQFAIFIARAKSDKYRLDIPLPYEKVDTTQVIGLVAVTTDGLNIRTGPSTNHSILGKVNTGGKLSVYAVEGNWLKVSYQGKFGYISKSYAKFLEQDGNSIGAVITTATANETLNLYYKPTSSSKKIGLINSGAKLPVYKEVEGYYLTIVDGLPGYVVKANTTVQTPPTPPVPEKPDPEQPVITSTIGKVTVSSLNIREAANTTSKTLKTLSKGTIVSVHSISGFWAKVTSDGVTGYVHKSYLKLMNQSGSSVKNRIIIIDPGHGGKDPGAVNSGSSEKAIVLKVSNLVKQKLVAAGAKVYMTRTGDTYPELSERVAYTKANYGEVFVSIHVNSATSSSAQGTETYYNISTGDMYEEDKKLATYINNEIVTNANMKNRGVKEGPFYVIRNMIIPSVLVELGFISNSEDRAKLINDKYVEIFAQSIYNGIVDYYGK